MMRVGDHEILALSERELTNDPRLDHLDDLPGADDGARPGLHHRPPDRRDGGAARGLFLRGRAEARRWSCCELVKVPSPERRLKAYPHELSGGLRQRAMIAMALSCRPQLLLADEPTTALDATVQIQVLVLLRKLQREMGMGVIFVTHDLGVAAQIADRVAVMYAGRIVEAGPVRDVLMNPQHPYTRGMLASTVHGSARGVDIEAIPGSPPDMRRLPQGCSFAPRCKYADDDCRAAAPPETTPAPGRTVCCFKVGSPALSS